MSGRRSRVDGNSLELRVALSAVREARRIVMKQFQKSPLHWEKEDHSPVSAVEILAERRIREVIHDAFPTHRIVGEETGTFDSPGDGVWYVDPIDGSSNFIRGIPLFGIQVAYNRGGVPEIGVSCVPAMGELMWAQRGRGAYLNSRRIYVSGVAKLHEAYVSLGGLNYFVARAHGTNMLQVVTAAKRVRAFGDAFAYHLVASGRWEAVLEAKIRYWDVAALQLIIAEAGGMCSTLSGGPLTADSIDVIASNGLVHDEILRTFHGRASDG